MNNYFCLPTLRLPLFTRLKDQLRRELEQEQKEINKVYRSIQTRTQTFKYLIIQVQPVASDFDPNESKSEYLQKKYSV